MSQGEKEDNNVSSNQDSSEYDPTLDFRSPSFDPLKALKMNNLITPHENVQPLDNIAAFRKYLPKSDENYIKVTKKQLQPSEQQPTKKDTNSKKSKWISPITQIMEKLSYGPTSMLYQCWKEKKRISVKIRSVNQIHSICEGDIVAFDKHMNLILQNVHETIMSQEDNSVILNKRQISQLFIKGDNVVLITRLD